MSSKGYYKPPISKGSGASSAAKYLIHTSRGGWKELESSVEAYSVKEIT